MTQDSKPKLAISPLRVGVRRLTVILLIFGGLMFGTTSRRYLVEERLGLHGAAHVLDFHELVVFGRQEPRPGG